MEVTSSQNVESMNVYETGAGHIESLTTTCSGKPRPQDAVACKRDLSYDTLWNSRTIDQSLFMSSLPEGGDLRESGLASTLFENTESLRVSYSSLVSCSTAVKTNDPSDEFYIVEVHSGSCEDFESTLASQSGPTYCVYDSTVDLQQWSSRVEGRNVCSAVSIPSCVCEVPVTCFRKCKSLRSVNFASPSKIERICAEALLRTSIESLSIPDSVVELCERCFFWVQWSSTRYICLFIET